MLLHVHEGLLNMCQCYYMYMKVDYECVDVTMCTYRFITYMSILLYVHTGLLHIC